MSLSDECLDIPTPWNEFLSAKYKRSFAYHTVRNRLPVILTQVIDHLSREKELMYHIYGEDCKEELKEVIGSLSKLKNEIQTNKPLIPFESSEPDVLQWNEFLKSSEESFGRPLSWFSSVWLHVECYMYRRIREAFAVTQRLHGHDPFKHLKEAAYVGSLDAIKTVGTTLLKIADEPNINIKKNLILFVKLSLWGNRCDLSLSNGKDSCQIDNPFDVVELLDNLILVNDINKVWEILSKTPGTKRVVDIVFDNAGYELFTDLCLADFLVKHKLADQIRFHSKMIPWFVSDTMESDFFYMLDCLITNESSSLQTIGKHWKTLIASNVWTIDASSFWTLPYSYDAMKTVDPELYSHLSQSSLTIFKGDLNYRKLMGDINWHHTETFLNGLRGFHPCPVLSLRTIKADVVTGMKDGQADKIAQIDSDWLTTGKYGIISCVD